MGFVFKHRRLGAIAAAAVMGTGAFVAGGQLAGAQDAGTPSPPQPLCKLVTEAEAQGALGHEVVVNDSGRVCSYTVSDPRYFASMSVSLGPDGVTQDSFRAGMAQYAEAANTALREVEGVGDAALATLNDQVSQIVAHDGDKFVTVLLINVKTPVSERVATLSGLARTALSRMG